MKNEPSVSERLMTIADQIEAKVKPGLASGLDLQTRREMQDLPGALRMIALDARHDADAATRARRGADVLPFPIRPRDRVEGGAA